MDLIQDYLPLLNNFLPPSLLNTLIRLTTTTFGIFTTLRTHISPLLSRLIAAPDVTSIVLLLVILFISFKILDMAYRAVMFWVNLVLRLLFWGSIAVLGFWMYNRGVDGFLQDVQGLGEHWTGQYERYSGEVRHFQRQKEEQIRRNQRKAQGGWRW